MERSIKGFLYLLFFWLFFGCSTSQMDNKNYTLVKSQPGGSSIVIADDENLESSVQNSSDKSHSASSIKSAQKTDLQNSSLNFKNNGNGITSNKKIFIINNIIYIKPENGYLELNQENLEIMKKSSDGWFLKDTVEFKLFNNDDISVYGTVEVDKKNGSVLFKSEKKFDPRDRYVLFIIVDNKPYEVILLAALEDIKDIDAAFSKVVPFDLGTYKVNELGTDSSIFCWNFLNNPVKIMMWLTDVEKDADVYLSIYNSFNNSHSSEIYFQRWKKTGNPLENYQWKLALSKTDSTKKIICDEEDSSIDGVFGTPDYSYANVYFEIKIISNGKDITSASTAKLNVVNYYTYIKNLKKNTSETN